MPQLPDSPKLAKGGFAPPLADVLAWGSCSANLPSLSGSIGKRPEDKASFAEPDEHRDAKSPAGPRGHVLRVNLRSAAVFMPLRHMRSLHMRPQRTLGLSRSTTILAAP